MPERVSDIEVFVSDIVAACETDASVDDGDLAVVAVVHEQVQTDPERIEHTTADALGFQKLYKVSIDEADASHIIVKDTDFYARLDTVFQDLLYGLPAFSVFDRVIFHENEFFGFFKLFFLGGDPLCGVVEVFDLYVLICRVMSAAVKILCYVCGAWIDLIKMLHSRIFNWIHVRSFFRQYDVRVGSIFRYCLFQVILQQVD